MRRSILLLIFLAIVAPVRGQDETKLGADFRGEGSRLAKSCSSFTSLIGCGQVLFTDHPLHIAVGSIAPENGFGAGVAFVTHYTPNEYWRLSWDTDAVASINGSWRAGVYMKAILTQTRTETTTRGRPSPGQNTTPPSLERPVFNLYAQAISLNKLDYFGPSPSSSLADRTFFGMREVIPGIDVRWPIFEPLKVSLYGEVNGRFVDVRESHGQPSPSIGQVYTEATAPGLAAQQGFAQFGEGIRIQPSFGDHVRLNYFAIFQQFVAPNSSLSFRRFTADLSHEFPLYKTTRTLLQKDHNGPDDCSVDIDHHDCPAITKDREGSFGIRLLISESVVPAGNAVPFYFQPTLGGSDMNGSPSLSSYQDYRFRAPNLLLLRGSFEHSLYGPLGFSFMVDGGKVAQTRSAIDFTHLAHTYSAGLTLRAGGFPQVYLMFAWGGKEGTHTIGSVDTALLGGSSRPSLY